MIVRGRVISLHHLGAAVRLEDGRLAAASAADVAAHRSAYAGAARTRSLVAFEIDDRPARRVAVLAGPATPMPPPATSIEFERKIAAFLASADQASTSMRRAPRHFRPKRRRVEPFEAKDGGA